MAKRKNVIAPNDKKALVAMEKMKLSTEQADRKWGDGLPFDPFRVETIVSANNNSAVERMWQSGRYYMWYKERCSHGDFMAMVDRTANSHTYVLNCMRLADYFPNSPALANLGTTKLRAITMFDKDVVGKYLAGGPLGDIPHDDVASMTTRELEDTVRQLREKVKRVEAVAKEKIRQKDEQITKLEFENDNRPPPTKEQIAIAGLAELDKDYFSELTAAMAAMRKAVGILNFAQCTPGVNVQILNEWINKYNEEMVLLNGVHEELTGMIDDLHPIAKGKIKEEV
jgi:hypothetical protein